MDSQRPFEKEGSRLQEVAKELNQENIYLGAKVRRLRELIELEQKLVAWREIAETWISFESMDSVDFIRRYSTIWKEIETDVEWVREIGQKIWTHKTGVLDKLVEEVVRFPTRYGPTVFRCVSDTPMFRPLQDRLEAHYLAVIQEALQRPESIEICFTIVKHIVIELVFIINVFRSVSTMMDHEENMFLTNNSMELWKNLGSLVRYAIIQSGSENLVLKEYGTVTRILSGLVEECESKDSGQEEKLDCFMRQFDRFTFIHLGDLRASILKQSKQIECEEIVAEFEFFWSLFITIPSGMVEVFRHAAIALLNTVDVENGSLMLKIDSKPEAFSSLVDVFVKWDHLEKAIDKLFEKCGTESRVPRNAGMASKFRVFLAQCIQIAEKSMAWAFDEYSGGAYHPRGRAITQLANHLRGMHRAFGMLARTIYFQSWSQTYCYRIQELFIRYSTLVYPMDPLVRDQISQDCVELGTVLWTVFPGQSELDLLSEFKDMIDMSLEGLQSKLDTLTCPDLWMACRHLINSGQNKCPLYQSEGTILDQYFGQLDGFTTLPKS